MITPTKPPPLAGGGEGGRELLVEFYLYFRVKPSRAFGSQKIMKMSFSGLTRESRRTGFPDQVGE
jgi:hypothetical protein